MQLFRLLSLQTLSFVDKIVHYKAVLLIPFAFVHNDITIIAFNLRKITASSTYLNAMSLNVSFTLISFNIQRIHD